MEEFLAAVFVALIFVAGMYCLLASVEGGKHDDCHSKGKLIQKQVTYRQWDGCYVNQNGLWVPLDVWTYNRDHGIVMK